MIVLRRFVWRGHELQRGQYAIKPYLCVPVMLFHVKPHVAHRPVDPRHVPVEIGAADILVPDIVDPLVQVAIASGDCVGQAVEPREQSGDECHDDGYPSADDPH